MTLRACFIAVSWMGFSAAALSPSAAGDTAWQEVALQGLRESNGWHSGAFGPADGLRVCWGEVDDFDFHFDWCMRLNRDSAPAQAEAEIVARTQEMNACFCKGYAGKTILQTGAAQNQSCGFTGPRWDNTNRRAFTELVHEAQWRPTLPNSEIAARLQGMKDCMAAKAAAPPPPSPPAQKTATAKNDVDIYKGPGGQFGTMKCQGVRCVMRDKTTAPCPGVSPGWMVQTEGGRRRRRRLGRRGSSSGCP